MKFELDFGSEIIKTHIEEKILSFKKGFIKEKNKEEKINLIKKKVLFKFLNKFKYQSSMIITLLGYKLFNINSALGITIIIIEIGRASCRERV